MNKIETSILESVQANPLASQQEIADSLGISRESVAGYIMRLTRKGLILGKGYILPESNNIVVIGGANVDIAGTCTEHYQGGDSNPGNVQQSAGGVGRNIAENLARLGNDVSIITLVGNDNRGQFIIEQAIQAGLKVQDVVQHRSLSTSTYLALHNQTGELIGSIADMAIMDQLTPEFLTAKMSRLQSASTIVVDANIPIETLAWLAEQSLSVFIVADAVSAAKAIRLRPLLNKIDLLKVNRYEALAILDHDQDDEKTGDELIQALQEKGVTTVLLSLAEEGVLLGTKTGNQKQGVPEFEMISDTGAGDAMLAGFVHSNQHHKNADVSHIHFALACAAATLETKEAVNPLLNENFIIQKFQSFLNQTISDSTFVESEN